MDSKTDINFDSLLKQNFVVIDARYRKYEASDEKYKYVIVNVKTDRENFYSDMIKNLTGKNTKEKETYELWKKILEHKLRISEQLNRDISIKVAAIDLLESKE